LYSARFNACADGNFIVIWEWDLNVLMGNPEGERPLRRTRYRWEDNKMDLGEIGTGLIWLRIGTIGGLL
jgi:hypothetical protein